MACLLATACFNPEDPPADTDLGSSGSSTGPTSGPSTTMPTVGSSGSGTSTTSDPTVANSSSSGSESSETGDEVPDWGEGEPPDFGDLGDDGEGNVLAVHALNLEEPVDVWLVGEAQPRATELAPGEAIRLEGVARDARRVVLARAGTLEAVACSEWFPLRADEQWAAVATRGEHDCNAQDDGVTPTFEQTLVLTGNPVRYVHAGRPDPLQIQRGGVPEGMLAPGETLAGSELPPDCKASGCSLSYAVSSMGIDAPPRYFTFATVQVTDVPPPGEFLYVIRGDVRQDWPRERNSIVSIAVTIEGGTRVLRRDPEVAFVAPETSEDVTFLIPTPPSVSPIAASPQCVQGELCPMEVQRFRPGAQQFYAQGPAGDADGEFELEGGERYVLTYAPSGQLVMLRDVFDRVDAAISVGRVVNWTDDLLTVGRVFNMEGQPFPNFLDVPAGEVSDEDEVPDGAWDLVSSFGGNPLGFGCFQPTGTPAPWRGFFWAEGHLNLDSWPPIQAPLVTLCF